MAELYEQYQSLLYVVKYMNDAGITTRNGKAWTPTAVRKILTNPWNIGHYVYNVHSGGKGTEKRSEDEWITVEDHHPAILDERLFYRIKFLLTRNKRGGVPASKTYVRKNIHIFGGRSAARSAARTDCQPGPPESKRHQAIHLRLWEQAPKTDILHEQVYL